MTASQLLLAGLLGSLIAASGLASVPAFEPARQGWPQRFGWFLLRYILPLAGMVAAVSCPMLMFVLAVNARLARQPV
jgi:hypothetical protein